jgi:hypothetical protein
MQSSLLVLLVLIVAVSAFRTAPVRVSFRTSSLVRMSAEDEQPFVPDADLEKKSFFESNRRVRLGRSRDEDGKSNIWSIEPRMEVVEGDEDGEEESATSTNLKVAGLAIGAAIACLPVFILLSKLLPDPDQF